MQNRTRSKEIFDQLCQVIPGGVNSPVRACLSVGQLPMVVERGYEDKLVDVDGHEYIDFCGSWGALIHGHAHPEILKASQERMVKGTTFGITTDIERQLASEIIKLVPSIEKIRFVSTGSEATMSVARLARGYTKRDIIVKFDGNFHGHADFFLVQAGSGVMELSTSSSSGIPKDIVKHTLSLPYNNIEAVKETFLQYGNQIAAVILEPIAGNMGLVPAKHEFIHFLRQITKEHGALLIFDEVITGFRVGLHCAQGYYGVQPDLTCFGKIIGGGFPAAAFGGRKEIMDHLAPLGSVYQGGTLSGNPVAMEAGLMALKMLQKPGFYDRLERKTELLLNPVKELIQERNLNACIQQVGSAFTVFFGRREVNNVEEAKQTDKELFGRFFRYMFENGVYVPPLQQEAWFVSAVHREENLVKTQSLMIDFLGRSQT